MTASAPAINRAATGSISALCPGARSLWTGAGNPRRGGRPGFRQSARTRTVCERPGERARPRRAFARRPGDVGRTTLVRIWRPSAGASVVAFEVDAQRRLQDELYQRAYFDPLTSLPNRDLCDRAVNDLASAGPSGSRLRSLSSKSKNSPRLTPCMEKRRAMRCFSASPSASPRTSAPRIGSVDRAATNSASSCPTAPNRASYRDASVALWRASPIPSSSKASKSSLRPKRA